MSQTCRNAIPCWYLVAAAALAAWPATGSAQTAAPPSSQSANPAESELSAELSILELYVGPWSVTERHYDRAGKVVATVKGTEEATWILDKHAIRRAYNTATDDFIFRAIGTISYGQVDGKYHGVWFDNVSTSGPMTSTGKWNGDTMTMTFTISRLGPDAKPVIHRVVEHFVTSTLRQSTTYLVQRDQVIKLLEVQYKRAHPCPENIQRIFDG